MATSTYLAPASTRSTVSTSGTRRFYAPELDVLRFAAFMLVFGRHVATAMGFVKKGIDSHAATATLAIANVPHQNGRFGWLQPQEVAQSLDFGVCLFFFLSAFLITRLLLIEREATGTVEVKSFYARRCLRIWPLYFFFLGLVVLLSQMFPVLHVSLPRLLTAVFFVSNWAAVLHGWAGTAIQPLWSVSVEEQFYLVWPVFARYGRRAIITLSCGMVGASLLTLSYFGHRPGSEVTMTWPNTLVQGLFLAGGALTACLAFPERNAWSSQIRIVLLVLGASCWLIASAVCHIARTQSPGALSLVGGYALVLAGTMLIFNGVAGWRSESIPGWLRHLGKISYGLYVFHVACLLLMDQAVKALGASWPAAAISPYISEFFSAVLALLLTILCAMLTYHWLERPFLQLKERFTTVRSRPV